MLEDLGCEVVTAASGQEGIDTLVADERIDVLITDVNMPVWTATSLYCASG
jgi:two-component system, cell cycle response regulator CpdR